VLPIDIIIPTFNRAQLLQRAVASILGQTSQNFQLIIVDDGSTDETSSILESYRAHSKITLLTQPNKGVSAARNFGIRHSQSEWLAFLDSDDEWMPNKLQLSEKFINDNPDIDFFHTDELWIRNGTRVNAPKKFSKSSENIFERSLDFCLISPSTVVMRRDLFNQHGPFNEEYPVCEDYDLWNKILAHENIGFIETPLTKKYGGHEDQLSTKYFAMDYWRFKSLLKLHLDTSISLQKRELIKDRLHQKGSLLLANYQKYQNQERIDEITQDLSNLRGVIL